MAPRTIIAKAPGKLLLAGAYSLLEPGRTGVVAALNRGVRASAFITEIPRRQKAEVSFSSRSFGLNRTVRVDEAMRNRLWMRELPFASRSISLAIERLAAKGLIAGSITINAESDAELGFLGKKTGLGSSAAACSSITAALFFLHDEKRIGDVFKFAAIAHWAAQGFRGSCFDVSASCFGTQVFVSGELRKEELAPSGSIKADRVAKLDEDKVGRHTKAIFPEGIKALLIDTGIPSSSPSMIKAMEALKKTNKEMYYRIIELNERVNAFAAEALLAGDPDELIEGIRASWRARALLQEKLGMEIEPTQLREICAGLEKQGALAAGLPGAGGGDSILALYSSEEARKKGEEWAVKKKLRVLEGVEVANNGLEIKEQG